MGGSPAGPDPGAITGLRRPDGSLAVTNAFDPHGTVTSRTEGTSSSTMRVDENGRVFERGDNRYFYGAMGDRTHVFDASKDRVIAQVGLLDIEYKRVGNALIRLRTEFIVPGGNVPLARVNESNNAVAFLHTDVQGSVAYVRGSTAGVDVRFDYTPFGEVLSARATGGASVERELRRFQGGLVDPSGAGYLQFGARLYDPVTQQWASADPAFHSYAYGFVGDSPYLRADPSGLQSVGHGGHDTQRRSYVDMEETFVPAPRSPARSSAPEPSPSVDPVVGRRHPVLIDYRAPVPGVLRATGDMADQVGRLPTWLTVAAPALVIPLRVGGEAWLRLPGQAWTFATGYGTSGRVATTGESVEAGVIVVATAAAPIAEGVLAGYRVIRVGISAVRAARAIRSGATRTLFRAVSTAELSSLEASGGLAAAPAELAGGVMEGRWFGTTAEDVTTWGRLFYQGNPGASSAFWILEVELPEAVLRGAYTVSRLDGVGAGVYIEAERFAAFNVAGRFRIWSANPVLAR